MTMLDQPIAKGLAGVVVDETAIARVEGDVGRLTYRGYPVDQLCEKTTYEDVVWLILFGELPTEEQARKLEEFMLAHASLTEREINLVTNTDPNAHPMQVIQGLIPLFDLTPTVDIDLPTESNDAREGLIIAAKLATTIAGLIRYRAGKETLTTDPSLTWHGNFLWLLNGEKPTQDMVHILDVTQILQLEHGFNASTFSCRVTASTLAPVESALSAAIGTLSGPLHGGADEAALRVALELGDPAKAEDYVLDCLASKKKIMGMGHRVYKVLDPRAKVLKPMAENLVKGTDKEVLFQTLQAIEDTMNREMTKRNKAIWPNVDFYKGVVLDALGIPLEFFTCMFGLSRIPGYLAHFLESRQDNRLIRPKAAYIGPEPREL
jgi:citrate synthase